MERSLGRQETQFLAYAQTRELRTVSTGDLIGQLDFAMGLIGFGTDIEKNLLEATSPFVFSTVNERSILRFRELIACDTAR